MVRVTISRATKKSPLLQSSMAILEICLPKIDHFRSTFVDPLKRTHPSSVTDVVGRIK